MIEVLLNNLAQYHRRPAGRRVHAPTPANRVASYSGVVPPSVRDIPPGSVPPGVPGLTAPPTPKGPGVRQPVTNGASPTTTTTASEGARTNPNQRTGAFTPEQWQQIFAAVAADPSLATTPGMGHDAGYNTDYAAAAARRDTKLNAIPGELADAGQRFGYRYDEPTGQVTEDASNPYSRRQLLVQSYDNARRGTTNSMAAQGQLYAGATERAQETNTNNYNQSSDALKRSFVDFAKGVIAARAGANDQFNMDVSSAGANETQRGIAAGPPPGAEGRIGDYTPEEWAKILAAVGTGPPTAKAKPKRQKTT